MAKNELVVKADYSLVTMMNPDVMESIQDEMESIENIKFDNIKIPSGGGTAFEIPGDNEDEPEIANEITGVIAYRHKVNAYWEDAYTGENTSPTCSSLDGKTGIVTETGETKNCANCPFNEYGSAKEGNGKACKNMRRLYILREGSLFPVVLLLPPTSIKNFDNYIMKLMNNLNFSNTVITKIKLKKAKSSGGITYSQAVFSPVGKLNQNQIAEVKSVAEFLKNYSAKNSVEIDEVAEGSTSKEENFTVVDNSEEVPVEFTEAETVE